MRYVCSRLSFILLLVITVAFNAPKALAVCSTSAGQGKFSATVTTERLGLVRRMRFVPNDPNGSPLTVEYKPEQCGGDPPPTASVYCEHQTEIFNADSMRAPLCGSTPERERANATCWSCGDGSIRCDGFDYRAGKTDGFFFNKQPLPGDDPGRVSQVWQVRGTGSTFCYNGKCDYPYSGQMIVVCGANNLACGASEVCQNMAFPEINNRGNNGSVINCSGNSSSVAVSGNFTMAESNCSNSSGPIDLLTYIAPNCSGGQCPAVRASVFTTGVSYVGAVNNRIVWVDSTHFKQVSNDKEILYEVAGGKIRMLQDTTWANEMTCPGTNTPVYQRPYTNSTTGGIDSYKSQMSCDETNTYSSALKAYLYENGGPTNKLCPNQPLADKTTTNSVRIIYHGAAKCLGQQQSVLVTQNTAGAGAGEVYVYGLGKGLIAWYQGIDFNEGTRAPRYWTANTELCSGTLMPFIMDMSCAVNGFPQETSVVDLPGLVDFACGSNQSGITCLLAQKIVEFVGFIMPQASVLKKPSVTKEARQLARAANPLTTHTHINQKKPVTRPITFSISGNLGAESETGDKCYNAKEGIVVSDFPEYNTLTGEGALLNAILMRGREADVDFQSDFPNQKLETAATRGCVEQSPGLKLRDVPGPSDGRHQYSETGATGAVFTAVNKLGQDAIDAFNNALASLGFFKGNMDAAFRLQGFFHTLTPYAETNAENLAAAPDGTRTGMIAGLMPHVIPIKPANANVLNQGIDQSGVGANSQPVIMKEVSYAEVGGIKESFETMNCALMPHGKQTNPDQCLLANLDLPDNTSDWAIQGLDQNPITLPFPVGRPDAGTIEEAILKATEAVGIPLCVLEGVGIIEGAYGYGPKDPRKNSPNCQQIATNSCSAAGPFQMTIGVDKNGNNRCPSCASNWVQRNGCPNAWASNGGGGNPCNYLDAASAAARKLKSDAGLATDSPESQKYKIIYAGYRYYGSNKAIARLNGCTYGEFVYKHCEPVYECIGENSLNFDSGQQL